VKTQYRPLSSTFTNSISGMSNPEYAIYPDKRQQASKKAKVSWNEQIGYTYYKKSKKR